MFLKYRAMKLPGRLAILLIVVSGCGVVRTPRNGHALVRKADRGSLAKYTPDMGLYPGPAKATVFYEITADAVRAFMGDSAKATCVVIWEPWAKSTEVKDLSWYQRLAVQADSAGMAFILVATYYDVPGVRRLKDAHGYGGRVFILDHDAYGKRPRARAQRRFVQDLLATDSVAQSVCKSEAYLFRGDSLVQCGTLGGVMQHPAMAGLGR